MDELTIPFFTKSVILCLTTVRTANLQKKEVKFFAKYALVPPVLVHRLKLKNPSEIADKFEVSFEAACYAFDYYQKWLRYGGNNYTDYEIISLKLFHIAA